jgi:hypothetical protein
VTCLTRHFMVYGAEKVLREIVCENSSCLFLALYSASIVGKNRCGSQNRIGCGRIVGKSWTFFLSFLTRCSLFLSLQMRLLRRIEAAAAAAAAAAIEEAENVLWIGSGVTRQIKQNYKNSANTTMSLYFSIALRLHCISIR